MGIAYVIVAIISAAVAVFAVQNGQAVPVRFLRWSLDAVPLSGAILAALGAGLILAGVPLGFSRLRMWSKVRGLERQVQSLERAIEMQRPAPAAPARFPVSREA